MKRPVSHDAIRQRLHRRMAALGLKMVGDVKGSDRWYILKDGEMIEQHASLLSLAHHYNVIRSFEEYVR